ncbi:MAG: putative lipid II flippase FtsW [Methylomonas sp.]|nr:putative lipid II flippase FtsW [Methylomonas sp.]PPD21566.1 MAG: putative lipid II flippase FtsW [Methylomonas sp.]PPD26384.1 MAG: putative lipid II flippase FtsW [Methylomonas sp.]PPD38123.1 MAG: putative lipid II flippase FtsW [Methylomonas sp.]PPD40478.1 MAG: putative lipid II flippase FtsW [Methylomonas sp.]
MSVPAPSVTSKPRKRQRLHIDESLLFATLSLLVIGFVMVTSSSLHLGVKLADDISHYPIKQLLHILLGLVVAGGVLLVPMKSWQKIGQPLFLGGLVLLLVVLIPGVGVKVNGSVRWLSVFGLRIQVSEVVKFISVIYMAGYITRHAEHVRTSLFGLVRPLLLFAVACLLLLMEPDFGSAVVILMIAMGMMFVGGARLSPFVLLVGLVSTAAALLAYTEPYRWKRVVSFLDPWDHARDSGYQLTQALISFGRGEVSGVGLGNGLQKLFYLPEAHTDFLFSVMGEELGLVGVMTIIFLFSVLIIRGFIIADAAARVGEQFSSLVAYGLTIWFGFQAIVNMGVNMGLLPTKGLTLPLMSYGGGSMMVMCGAVAALFRIHYETTERDKRNVKGRTA